MHRVNVVRVHHHLQPLHRNIALGHAATAHSRAMLARQSFSHTAPLARLAGVTAGHTFGEAIAWMPSTSAAGVVSAWMHSPPHRALLLSPRFHRIGVGTARGTLGGRAGTTFTADFAG